MPQEKRVEYYAHSVERKPKIRWQTLEEHLHSVGDLAADFADAFSARNHGKVAGQLHDLGKYTQEFQARLEGIPLPITQPNNSLVSCMARTIS
ncbi:hypothetical protein GCM10011502_18630 [Oceanisphaera marina]|uniref:HD Cas3-type domain-containing protein n=1 Tax=Oceanisphaera marina TaxID=2017550 RepID=A0ABQ1IKZ5_9GAMM|nr:CRISPR-associated endonuclease Cas3'' [Oceanisphaera marina]GGB45592.1 hypothetical protein GCM10011502_18630 [Oceanisphaera marina]